MLGIGGNKEETIKVFIIGDDDVLRVGEAPLRQGTNLIFDQYILDPDAIFQSVESHRGIKTNVATIAYYANNPYPIKRSELKSIFKPEEIGTAVETAAWAYATLFFRERGNYQTLSYILMIIAILVAAASAGIGYMNYKTLGDIDNKMTAMQNYFSTPVNVNNLPAQGNGNTVPVAVTVDPTPIQTLPPVPIMTAAG